MNDISKKKSPANWKPVRKTPRPMLTRTKESIFFSFRNKAAAVILTALPTPVTIHAKPYFEKSCNCG
ncbi:MAG TPA: hypothetical protein DF409_05925 [Bacteroidales bacterium]|nr:hypothetical protein [Bacteroidales bacterium]